METDSPVVYHGTTESRFPQKEPPKNFLELTKEEREIFRQCNKESLYYRCLPLALAGMVATQLAVRKGMLSSHPIWGSSLKLTGAGFLGWMFGKISYRNICEDKFLTLENSSIADAIRRNRGISIESFRDEYGNTKTNEDNFGSKSSSYTTYSDDYNSSSGSLNLDMDKNIQYSGLDDRERPSTDREIIPSSENAESTPKLTTYEDLRQRNREEYEKSLKSYAPRPRGQEPPPRPWSSDSYSPPPPRRPYASPDDSGSKNKYGDNWDNPKFI